MKRKAAVSPKGRVRKLTKAVRGLLGRIEKATPTRTTQPKRRSRRKARR